MNSKIRIYSIVLAIIYGVILAHTMFLAVDQFKAGFRLAEKKTSSSSSYMNILHVAISPKDGIYTYPEIIKNTITGQDVCVESTMFKIDLSNTNIKIPNYLKYIRITLMFLSFVILATFLYLPFLFFSTVKQATKGHILTPKVIRKIQYMGYIILFSYVANIVSYLSDFMISKYVVEFEKYNVVFDSYDFGYLLLGFVTLLMAEILKVSGKLKEEQDLTI